MRARFTGALRENARGAVPRAVEAKFPAVFDGACGESVALVEPDLGGEFHQPVSEVRCVGLAERTDVYRCPRRRKSLKV